MFASPDNGFFSLGIVGLITSVIATAAFVHKPWPSGLALAVALILVGCLGFAMRPQRMGRLVWQQGTRDTATYGADNYVRIGKAVRFLAAHRSHRGRHFGCRSMTGMGDYRARAIIQLLSSRNAPTSPRREVGRISTSFPFWS